MEALQSTNSFFQKLSESLSANSFIGISMGNYKGPDEKLKNVYAKKILIKNEVKLSFTFRNKTNDIVKNHPLSEGIALIENLWEDGFGIITLFDTQADYLLERINPQKNRFSQKPPSKKELPNLEHDKSKNRPIASANKPYLHALQVTDKDGNVYKHAQDKYKQINHYIDLISPLIKDLPKDKTIKVADMGSGKGYLTFALYDYLVNVLQLDAEVTGVEFRPDMVALCNTIAKDAGFTKLHFVEGTIERYDSKDTNVLIALHACDTATDDAIAKGIHAHADLIVVAPCCHKQIRREIEKHKPVNDLQFVTKHGIFLERQAEMVTDSIRAMILEYSGYKTKVFEFISDMHTPKNVMIVGSKHLKPQPQNTKVLQQIKDAKSYFGIETHHLEQALGW